MHNNEGSSYPIDEAGQLYVSLDFGDAVTESAEVEIEKETKT